ncbi:hypothetical protein BJ508DRAFT_410294 [Ascobolus immersus RN42]|uniref:Nudix hydrolase domain-containing protein n=1 Tax=Ascobolus immersus RN42 TaxID=1160509 RepID=A0A3N4IQ20_ASCIM|nr:hypothetical protein BJ508DRAFT_410294 [Ascobolus immersus RN42]
MPPTTFPDTLTHKNFTLIFPLDAAKKELVLGLKKRGFGKGCYNGFGGKVEPPESILDGAIRELEEESTLVPTSIDAMKYVGLLLFHTLPSIANGKPGDNVLLQVVYVFTLASFNGTPTETEEMAPKLFTYPLTENFMIDNMLPSTKQWLPTLLDNIFSDKLASSEKYGADGSDTGFLYYASWESGSTDMLNCVLKSNWKLGSLEEEDAVSDAVLLELMTEAAMRKEETSTLEIQSV